MRTFDYHSFNKYLLSTNCNLDIVAGAGHNDDLYLGSERIPEFTD